MTGQSKFLNIDGDEDIEGLMRSGRTIRDERSSGNNSNLNEATTPPLPMWVEGAIVGGIALAVYVLPPVAHFLKKKMRVVRVHMSQVTGRLRVAIADKWEPINRKRKRGSIVRVVASFLPDYCFNPPCRMFVPSAGYSAAPSWRSVNSNNGLNMKNCLPPPEGLVVGTDVEEFKYEQDNAFALDDQDGGNCCTINQDGLIVAFAIDQDDGDSMGTELDTVEIEDTCSNPEGWDPIFQPRANSTRFACSTPEPSCRSSCLNDSFSTQNSEVDSTKQDVKEELADLRNMVKELLFQMGNLNQTSNNNRTGSASCFLPDNSALLPNNSSAMNTPLSSIPKPPPLPPTINVSSVPAIPGPPPPPPPPMPSTIFTGSTPLVTPRKTEVQKPKPAEKSKSGSCLSINLKDIKGVQLRPTPKSPGGTPLKNASLSAHSSTLDLTDVLKKRYQAWHTSPTPSEKDFGDKENGEESAFDDSFLEDDETPVQFIADLKPAAKDKPRPVRMSNENQVPFGQHLLKKGNKNSPLEVLPRIKVLAEQNI